MDFNLGSSLFDFGSKIIDRLIPDPAQKSAAQLELLKLQQAGTLAELAADTDLQKGQLDVNKVEAASESLFVSGWRPFVGWVCGMGLAVQYVVGPFFTWITHLFNTRIDFPIMDLSTMLPLLIGMLGFGYYRSKDKANGV